MPIYRDKADRSVEPESRPRCELQQVSSESDSQELPGNGSEDLRCRQEFPAGDEPHPCPPWSPGDPIWYAPTLGGARYPGVVDSEPRLLGGVTWVVRLRDMCPEYGIATGRAGRTTVAAAECELHVSVRGVTHAEHSPCPNVVCAAPLTDHQSDSGRIDPAAILPPTSVCWHCGVELLAEHRHCERCPDFAVGCDNDGCEDCEAHGTEPYSECLIDSRPPHRADQQCDGLPTAGDRPAKGPLAYRAMYAE